MATSIALATQLREIVDHILLSMAQFIGEIKYKFGRCAQEIVPVFAFQTIESKNGVNDAGTNSGADLLILIRERNINFNKDGKHPYKQVNLNKQEVGKLFVKTIRLLGKLCTNQGVYATKVICAGSGV